MICIVSKYVSQEKDSNFTVEKPAKTTLEITFMPFKWKVF